MKISNEIASNLIKKFCGFNFARNNEEKNKNKNLVKKCKKGVKIALLIKFIPNFIIKSSNKLCTIIQY